MDTSVKIALHNTPPEQDIESRAQRKRRLTAERQARFRQRTEAASARMKRIADKAQEFNEALKVKHGEQFTLPLSLVADDVEQTLVNLTEWLTMPEQLREEAQNKRKRR